MKLTLTNITSGYASTTATNANNALIETALENTLSRNGESPNQMLVDLDMNGHRIINELAQTGEGFIWKGAWVTALSYSLNNLVSNASSSYICTVVHTAGANFATDLAAGKWQLLAQQGLSGAGTGDMLIANNLSELTATKTTARGNISAAASGVNNDIISLTGITGGINEARGSVAMHATTMDLWSQPNIIDGTGAAVTITAIANAPQAGARRVLYPYVGTTITNGATFAVDGAANYTTAAGDALEFEAVTTSTYKVHITKKDGTAVVGSITIASTAETEIGTSTTKVVSPDGLQGALGFSKHYKNGDTETTGATAGTTVLAHGLPATPRLVMVRLKCKTTDNGYAVGDEIMVSMRDSAGWGSNILLDATNITIEWSSLFWTAVTKGGGAGAGLVATNWYVIVDAWA